MKPALERHAGYTIIEVMIFLIISAALLLGALSLFNGRIQRTQFTQSVNELATRITSTANEVSTGTYPQKPNFVCDASSGTPSLSLSADQTTDTQGTKSGCIFVGKVMNPAVSAGTCTVANSSGCIGAEVYTAIGRRLVSGATVSTQLTGPNGANPILAASNGGVDLTSSFTYGYGTHVTRIGYKDDNSNVINNISAFGLFQTFGGSYTNSGSLNSGAQNVQLAYVQSAIAPVTPTTKAAVATAVLQQRITPLASNQSIIICLQSGANNQVASIILGGGNSGYSSKVTIGDPLC